MDFEEFFTMFNLAREEMAYQCENCGHIFNLVDVEWEDPRESDVLQCPACGAVLPVQEE